MAPPDFDDDEEFMRLFADAFNKPTGTVFDHEFDTLEDIVNGAARRFDGAFDVRRGRDYRAARPARDVDALFAAIEEIAGFLKGAATGEPVAALSAVRRLRSGIEKLETEAVVYARACGWSWRHIAAALGVAAQTVHRRYAAEDVSPRRRRKPH